MNQGHIIQEGTPKEVFDNFELLKKVKMDVPQVTELAWNLARQGIPIKTPVLTEEQFVTEMMRIYEDGKNREDC